MVRCVRHSPHARSAGTLTVRAPCNGSQGRWAPCHCSVIQMPLPTQSPCALPHLSSSAAAYEQQEGPGPPQIATCQLQHMTNATPLCMDTKASLFLPVPIAQPHPAAHPHSHCSTPALTHYPSSLSARSLRRQECEALHDESNQTSKVRHRQTLPLRYTPIPRHLASCHGVHPHRVLQAEHCRFLSHHYPPFQGRPALSCLCNSCSATDCNRNPSVLRPSQSSVSSVMAEQS